MITHEPECVALKRRGAEHVLGLLAGKSRQEELKFWGERTKRLRFQQKQKQKQKQIPVLAKSRITSR